MLRRLGQAPRSAGPVVGLQAHGISEPARLPGRFDELVHDYLSQVRRRQPHGPYQLLGWSLGGNIAHAMAARLLRAGEAVSLLALLDSYPAETWEDTHYPHAAAEDDADVLVDTLTELGVDVTDSLPDGASPEDILALARQRLTADSFLDEGLLTAIVRAPVRNVRLVRQVATDVFAGPALFFTATRSSVGGARSASLWHPYVTGGLENHSIACTHEEIMAAQALALIGQVLRDRPPNSRRPVPA